MCKVYSAVHKDDDYKNSVKTIDKVEVDITQILVDRVAKITLSLFLSLSLSLRLALQQSYFRLAFYFFHRNSHFNQVV